MAFRVLIDKKDLQIGETMVFDYTEVGIPRQGFWPAWRMDGWPTKIAAPSPDQSRHG